MFGLQAMCLERLHVSPAQPSPVLPPYNVALKVYQRCRLCLCSHLSPCRACTVLLFVELRSAGASRCTLHLPRGPVLCVCAPAPGSLRLPCRLRSLLGCTSFFTLFRLTALTFILVTDGRQCRTRRPRQPKVHRRRQNLCAAMSLGDSCQQTRREQVPIC